MSFSAHARDQDVVYSDRKGTSQSTPAHFYSHRSVPGEEFSLFFFSITQTLPEYLSYIPQQTAVAQYDPQQ